MNYILYSEGIEIARFKNINLANLVYQDLKYSGLYPGLAIVTEPE